MMRATAAAPVSALSSAARRAECARASTRKGPSKSRTYGPVSAGGRPAIVGVGLAGRSHFSASFAPHPTLADTVLVEIACRVQEPPVWLGSTYRAADGRLVRMVASHTAAGGLPRTIQWSYLCGSRGIVAATGAACDPPADASHF
jgi:hypothetical protein